MRDHRIGTIGEAAQSVVFYPFAQRPRSLIVHARTTASPDALVTEVQRAMDDIDATIPLSVQTLRGATSLELTMRRVGTLLMGTLGAVGLLLAMIGLSQGVMMLRGGIANGGGRHQDGARGGRGRVFAGRCCNAPRSWWHAVSHLARSPPWW